MNYHFSPLRPGRKGYNLNAPTWRAALRIAQAHGWKPAGQEATLEELEGEAEASGQKEESRSPGRPPATHGRTRFTTIIDPAKRDAMKLLALKAGKTISDVFEEAVSEYIHRKEAEVFNAAPDPVFKQTFTAREAEALARTLEVGSRNKAFLAGEIRAHDAAAQMFNGGFVPFFEAPEHLAGVLEGLANFCRDSGGFDIE